MQVRIQGDRGSGPPPPPRKNHTNKGFLSNTGPDPQKITNLSSQHSMLGLYRHASEMPFKWRYAGGPMIARLIVVFWSTKKKNFVKVGPPLTKCSGSAHGMDFNQLLFFYMYKWQLLSKERVCSLWELILSFESSPLQHEKTLLQHHVFSLFVWLIWFFTSHQLIFQLNRDVSSWVEPVLS